MMAEKYYAYAVARIRTKELGLLKGAFLEQLLAAKSYEECIQLLSEKGWGDGTTMDAEQILRGEEKRPGRCWRIWWTTFRPLTSFSMQTIITI